MSFRRSQPVRHRGLAEKIDDDAFSLIVIVEVLLINLLGHWVTFSLSSCPANTVEDGVAPFSCRYFCR